MTKLLPWNSTWDPPRGPRAEDGSWRWTLLDRPQGTHGSDLEKWSVADYRNVIHALESGRALRKLSVRALAGAAGLSASVTFDALSGSAWPRWETLDALASATGQALLLDGGEREVVAELTFLVQDAATDEGMNEGEAARAIGIRPNTLYDLKKSGRSPSCSTVFAVAQWCQRTIQVWPA